MQTFQDNALRIIRSSWGMAFILLILFLATTGYKYGWDDQHLEIPLLKSLIDPTLYQGDYYVQSLKTHFPSYFYPILARFISVEQIPAAYLILFLVSRYFLFFWIYKLWLFIGKSRWRAFMCVVVFLLIARVDEFTYRTFSHQEFALGIIFAGIYYFFKERFILAAFLFGLSANFHALYSLFPMFYMGLYLLFYVRRHSFKTLLLSTVTFFIFSAPFWWWTIQKYIHPEPATLSIFSWLEIYQMACPQNFIFPLVPLSILLGNGQAFLDITHPYLFLILLFVLNLNFNPLFTENKKALVFCWGAFFLLFLTLLFTYLYPKQLFLDLNLIRNTQYLFFLIMGYTTFLIIDLIETRPVVLGLSMALLFTLSKYTDLMGFYCITIMICILGFLRANNLSNQIIKYGAQIIFSLITVICLGASVIAFNKVPYRFFSMVIIITIFVGLLLFAFLADRNRDRREVQLNFRRLLYIFPLFILLIQYVTYNIERAHIEAHDDGFWRLQRSWEDMQRYVKIYVPKDAKLMVPYDMEMGGFRILSDRPIVMCYRDCGIVGFDYNAAIEWRKRIADLDTFQVAISADFKDAVKSAILKYKARYIVYMRYAAPEDSTLLRRIYTNTDFVLYEVAPIPDLEKETL